MTQLTLGLDRDSALVAAGFDERDAAVKFMISTAIKSMQGPRQIRRHLRQGPSDHPDLAEWLLQQRIDTMSLNPDTVVETWLRLGQLAGTP